MSSRRFSSPAGLGTAACSILLTTGLIGCGEAPPEGSDAVETRSDAFETCETNTFYHLEPDGESGAECQATICTKANGCWESHSFCSDGWSEDNQSNCWDEPEVGCYDDWDCPYASRCNEFTQVCEY